MKNLKALFVTTLLISSSSFACDHTQTSNIALASAMHMAKAYNTSKVGVSTVYTENDIASAHVIIFNPSFNGVPLVSDLIGVVKIDLKTCREINSYAFTFLTVTFN